MKLITLLKSLPSINHEVFGYAINYCDISDAYEANGYNNSEILNSQLRSLANEGIIELCVDELFDADLIIAVKIK